MSRRGSQLIQSSAGKYRCEPRVYYLQKLESVCLVKVAASFGTAGEASLILAVTNPRIVDSESSDLGNTAPD